MFILTVSGGKVTSLRPLPPVVSSFLPCKMRVLETLFPQALRMESEDSHNYFVSFIEEMGPVTEQQEV